ncbi:MAG: lysostaphin resistance A-like protein [Sandaracinaceae bacterium]
MVWKLGAALSGALALTGLVWSVIQVASLEAHEVQAQESHRLEGEGGTRLLEAHLYAEQRVVFELCSDDRMPPAWQDRIGFVIWRPRTGERMSRTDVSVDVLAMARRNDTHACLLLGEGRIEHEGDYAIEARWDGEPPEELADTTLTARIASRTELTGSHVASVGLTWLGTLLFSLCLALRRREPARSDGPEPLRAPDSLDPWEAELEAAKPKKRPWPPVALVVMGVVSLVIVFVASGFLPAGRALGLVVGLLLGALEIALAVWLFPVRSIAAKMDGLALFAPRRWYIWFPAALLAGALLVMVAKWAIALIPSTGQSAIQALVSWPSGLLSFAGMAVFVPVAEEVFFRGFVYGALETHGRLAAFLGGWLLFVVAHLPQTFGQWGAFVGIFVTGLGLTSLRAASRSTLVPAVAHLVYNGTLAFAALVG